MKLVFIHGRDQQGKDRVALQQSWENAFEDGLHNAGLSRPGGLELGFPFYADELDRLVHQLNTPLIADVQDRGAAADTQEAEFRGEFLQELAYAAGVTDDDIKAHYTEDLTEKGFLNWKWVHAIVKALDRSKKLGNIAIDSFTRDVYVYLTNAAVQKRINDIVKPHVVGDPCVVVGHSLGSVVGYNVLREASNKVVKYVTIGSPLAVNAIKSRLKLPLDMPRTTKSWFNARSKGDIVALYPLDNQHFPIDPAITNKTNVNNTTDNQHGIVGYLPDPDVARQINQALTNP
jgi:pimeloyl-ACP methyl ester carboxylesterase